MHRDVARRLATIGCLIALGLACRDDQPLSEQEYFQQLQATLESADAKFQPLTDLLNLEYESEAEEIQARQDFFEADLRILKEVEDDLKKLRPPGRLRDAHREYTTALANLEDIITRLTGRISEVQSLAEIDELFADAELQAATDRFDQACFELEGLASRGNIDADLDCD